MDDSFNPVKENPLQLKLDEKSNSAIKSTDSAESHKVHVNSPTPSLDFDREKSLTYEMMNVTSPDYFEFFRTPSPSPFPSASFEEPDFTKSLPEQIRRQILVNDLPLQKNIHKDENNWVLLPSNWAS